MILDHLIFNKAWPSTEPGKFEGRMEFVIGSCKYQIPLKSDIADRLMSLIATDLEAYAKSEAEKFNVDNTKFYITEEL